ncbi:hypothetical protein [Streptomyces sp. NPDC001828]|uniref:hypothetical protein n=1 Tax=Streptomyces sp. NPDC001828 TaxID=3364615 RepID=UPI00367AA071
MPTSTTSVTFTARTTSANSGTFTAWTTSTTSTTSCASTASIQLALCPRGRPQICRRIHVGVHAVVRACAQVRIRSDVHAVIRACVRTPPHPGPPRRRSHQHPRHC